MNKRIVTITTFLLLATAAFAQPGERIKQLRIGYLTEKIPLSSEIAQVFWPVYNAYSQEMETLRAKGKDRLMDARQHFDTMSEQQLIKLSDDFIAFKGKEQDILEKYHPKFKQVLPPHELIRFYRAEQDFPVWLLRQFKNSRQAGPDRPGVNPRN